MTICIAAICDGAKSIVVASDRLGLYQSHGLQFDDSEAKVHKVLPKCFVLGAGKSLTVQRILSSASEEISNLEGQTTGEITEKLRRCFIEIRQTEINDYYFRPQSLELTDYCTGKYAHCPRYILDHLQEYIRRHNFHVQLLVAGIDTSGAHLHIIYNPANSNCIDEQGFECIGAEAAKDYAFCWLKLLEQNVDTALNRAVFNVYHAKKCAEVVPGIGMATDMYILGEEEARKLSIQELERLHKISSKLLPAGLSSLEHEVSSFL